MKKIKERKDISLQRKRAGEWKLGKLPVADVKKKDGIRFIFGKDNHLTIRPSGTEPKVRFYGQLWKEVTIKNINELILQTDRALEELVKKVQLDVQMTAQDKISIVIRNLLEEQSEIERFLEFFTDLKSYSLEAQEGLKRDFSIPRSFFEGYPESMPYSHLNSVIVPWDRIYGQTLAAYFIIQHYLSHLPSQSYLLIRDTTYNLEYTEFIFVNKDRPHLLEDLSRLISDVCNGNILQEWSFVWDSDIRGEKVVISVFEVVEASEQLRFKEDKILQLYELLAPEGIEKVDSERIEILLERYRVFVAYCRKIYEELKDTPQAFLERLSLDTRPHPNTYLQETINELLYYPEPLDTFADLLKENILDKKLLPVVVSDVDETLTPSREKAPLKILERIIEILEKGGIFIALSGSPRENIENQFLIPLLKRIKKGEARFLNNLHLLVNSGRVMYSYDEQLQEFKLQYIFS